jgi:hypothetical protein
VRFALWCGDARMALGMGAHNEVKIGVLRLRMQGPVTWSYANEATLAWLLVTCLVFFFENKPSSQPCHVYIIRHQTRQSPSLCSASPTDYTNPSPSHRLSPLFTATCPRAVSSLCRSSPGHRSSAAPCSGGVSMRCGGEAAVSLIEVTRRT